MSYLPIPVLRRETAEFIEYNPEGILQRRNNPYTELTRNMNLLRRYHSILQFRPLAFEENEEVFNLLVRRLILEQEIRNIQAFFRRHS